MVSMQLYQQLPANTGDDSIYALANGNHAFEWQLSAKPACHCGKPGKGRARDTPDIATQAKTRLNGMEFVETRAPPPVNMDFGLV